jgi:hypothetical protein
MGASAETFEPGGFMETMDVTIRLPQVLVERAREAGLFVGPRMAELVASELARIQPAEIRKNDGAEQKMRREKDAFVAQQADLRQRYPGEYIAMHNGQVLDHDRDLSELHRRVYVAIGTVTVLLKQVDQPVDRDLFLRSPRLERTAS